MSKSMPTPTDVLNRWGACEAWRRRVRGKTWADVLADVRHGDDSGAVMWLAEKIGDRSGVAYTVVHDASCPVCYNDGRHLTLLALPLGVWTDLIKSALSW